MGKMGVLDYEEWLAGVPQSLKQDPLWSFQVYPKALLPASRILHHVSCPLHLASL
jgi:hypothetical protein